MKKCIAILLSAAIAALSAACGAADAGTAGQDTRAEQGSADGGEIPEDLKILTAYFTVPETDGVDTAAGASRVATGDGVLGNTEFIAGAIQSAVGGDLFAIETEQEYPGSHDALLDFAYTERMNDARPALASEIEGFEEYDVVFIGYPNWNADLPMPLYTFFEEYDFSGKKVIPFVTHGGSGFSGTVRTIKELEPGADVIGEGLSVSRNNAAQAYDEAAEWARNMVAE